MRSLGGGRPVKMAKRSPLQSPIKHAIYCLGSTFTIWIGSSSSVVMCWHSYPSKKPHTHTFCQSWLHWAITLQKSPPLGTPGKKEKVSSTPADYCLQPSNFGDYGGGFISWKKEDLSPKQRIDINHCPDSSWELLKRSRAFLGQHGNAATMYKVFVKH